MDIETIIRGDVTILAISGEIDGKTAPIAHEQMLPVSQAGGKLLLDMTKVEYMSSAGLRLMLLVYRQSSAAGGQLVLVGLSEEIQDTMSATGFLTYFTTCETVDAGVAALQ